MILEQRLISDFGFDGLLEFGWAETAWASGTGVEHTLICINKVETFGPSGIGDHDGIVYFINIGFDTILHGYFALASNLAAFFNGGGVVNTGVFEFPTVFGMCFANVDDEELDLFVVLCIQVTEADRLTNKGRSCKTAENEGDGFFFAEVG